MKRSFKYGANFKITGKCDPEMLSYSGAWKTREGSFGDLAAHIGKGHPWMPALLDANKRRWQQNANYAEIVAVDIDKGMTIAEAIAHPFISQYAGLVIESASSQPDHEKFRIVFRLPEPITDWQILRICNCYLIDLLGVADRACKDASRFFFGAPGRSPAHLIESAILPADFIATALSWQQEQEAIAQKQYEEALAKRQQYQGSDERDTLGLVKAALAYAPVRSPGCGNYGDCVAIAAALLNEFGEAIASQLLEEFIPPHKASGDNWNPAKVVQGLARSKSARPASAGTIFHIAKQNGFKFPTEKQCTPPSKKSQSAAKAIDAPAAEKSSTPAKEQAKEKPKKIKLPAESTIAWELEKKLKDRIIWSEQHDSWFLYEGEAPGAWAPVKDGAIRQLIVQHVKDLVGDDLYDGCSSRYIAGICSLLKDDTLRVADFNGAIAKKKHLIGFRNGVYNLQDQIFVAGHDPQNYLLSTLPRDYAPLARQWDEIFEWLNWVFDGNREYIDTFNCVAAAIMRRMSSLQVFPHFKGIGGGGKSVALKLLATLVGDKNTVSSSLEDIAINRFETARLVGKLLCLMPDQDNWHGSIGNFLKLTGRDLVRIERKNKDGGEFLFEGFVAISSNPDVFTSRTGRELTRRQLLLPFTKDVSSPDPYFADRLASGMHGWTNYLLSLSEGFIVKTLQGDRRRAINPDQWESKKRSDSIAAWLDECCAINPAYSHKIGSNKSDLSSLFGSYQTYCLNTGSIPKGLREFSDLVITALKQAFPERIFEKKRTSTGFMVTGISLRADHPGDPFISDLLPQAIASGDDFVAEYARWLDTAPPEADIIEPLEPIEIEATEPEKVCAEAIAAPPPESAPVPKKQKAIAPTPKQDQPKPQPTEVTEFGGLRVGDAVILDLSELDKKTQKEMRAAISLPPDGTQGVISSFKENSFKKGVFSPRVKFPDREDPVLVVDFVLKLVPKDTPSSDFVR